MVPFVLIFNEPVCVGRCFVCLLEVLSDSNDSFSFHITCVHSKPYRLGISNTTSQGENNNFPVPTDSSTLKRERHHLPQSIQFCNANDVFEVFIVKKG